MDKGRDRESIRGQSPIALSPIAAEALFSDLPQGNAYPPQLGKYFTDNVYLADPWHSDSFLVAPKQVDTESATWRLKDRMKTAGVALVVCLNLGIDPPDVVKPFPCARKECWSDPLPHKQKGLETIGNALQQQYEKWQSKAKYKQCLDPTSEDLRKVCMNLRKTARSDRLLLHYNGHGVPKPTRNGELWVFGKHYTHYMPVAVSELKSWLGSPAIYVLDCSGAGALLPHFIDNNGNNDKSSMSPTSSSNVLSNDNKRRPESLRKTPSFATIQAAGTDNSTIVLAACRANESLPLNPQYPADIFTACLTTPISITLRWFILQNPLSMSDVNPDLAENIPGKQNLYS
jgi:regulator-associated protein of mTOR